MTEDWKDVARRQRSRVQLMLCAVCLFAGWWLAIRVDSHAATAWAWYQDWRDLLWFWLGQWIWIVLGLAAASALQALLFAGLPKPPGDS